MRSLILPAFAAILTAALSAQPLVPSSSALYPAAGPNTTSGHAPAYAGNPAPLTFVKKLGEPQRLELVSGMCAASDGNVYLAGKQGNNPMIAKMTATGEPIWVRQLPAGQPNLPLEWSSIIEDSDGMIVLCGTEGTSPTNRRTVGMRYHPVNGSIFWFKRYQPDNPLGLTILEKSPDGNFVLQQNFRTNYGNGPSQLTAFFTLNRSNGNTTGSSISYQDFSSDMVPASSVIHDGSLYTAGSWITKATGEVRPFLIKLSLTTFFPEWAYLQTPDTSTGATRWMPPADLVFDGNQAVIAGSGYLNTPSASGPAFVYLEKHHPDGSLAWTKRYDLGMTPEDVLVSDDTYVVFGRLAGSNRFGLLQTDTNGNVLRTRILDAASSSPVSAGTAPRQNLALRLPTHLLLADHTLEPGESDIVLLRTDLNLGLEDSCGLLQDVQVNSQLLTAASNTVLFAIGANTPASQATPGATTLMADSLSVHQLCPVSGPEPEPDSCKPNTFLNVFGAPGKLENLTALCAAPDGNLYLAGRKGSGFAIAKMRPEGTFIWVRTTTVPPDEFQIAEIIVDSEGMIAGIGQRGSAFTTGAKTFAFRYDPSTNQILWAQLFDSVQPEGGGILEKSPGGNYLLYHTPKATVNGVRIGEMLELDRTTGQIVPAFARRYTQPNDQSFVSMVRHGDALYATGFAETVQNSAPRRRMILTRLDASTGEVIWSRIGLSDWPATGYFSGTDLIVDDSSLVVLYRGTETSNTIIGQAVPIYLQKTSFDGQVIWVKKYETSELPRELVATPDGYVIWGGVLKRILLKTDKQGSLLKSGFLSNNDYFSTAATDFYNGQALQLGQHLVFASHTARNNQIGQYTTLLKTGLNLDVEFACDFAPYPLPAFAAVNPVNYSFPQLADASPATQQPLALELVNDQMTPHLSCPFCANPPCLDKPDITFRIESVGCDTAAFLAYRLCNAGKQPFTGDLRVGVLDKNPLTSAALLLDLLYLPNLNLPADSCQTGKLKIPVFWANYDKLYTLAGIGNGLTTPVNPAGFPYNGIAECDYGNNLDSLVFQFPPAPPKPDLGPDRTVCAGDSVTLDAGGGYISYHWSDGSTSSIIPVGATGVYTVNATDACGRIQSDTVAVTVLPQPAPTLLTIQFYPGDTVTLAGQYYTQSDTIVLILSSAGGCDSVVTYILQQVAETACDVKNVPGGCIKYELLSIRLDSLGYPHYRLRLTNTCASPLRFAYFQLPDGLTAEKPLDGATYTAPGGNAYTVRNPNASPFHSTRYKPVSGTLNNGKSDIFEYTLPKQAQPAYILVSAKLEDGSSSEAHLNTFNCPVLPYQAGTHKAAEERDNRPAPTAEPILRVSPNPTTGLLLVDMPGLAEASVHVLVLNAQGQTVLEKRENAIHNRISLELPGGLAGGLYYLRVQPAGGKPASAKFVLARSAN